MQAAKASGRVSSMGSEWRERVALAGQVQGARADAGGVQQRGPVKQTVFLSRGRLVVHLQSMSSIRNLRCGRAAPSGSLLEQP
jgi:hypothetical protein